MKGLNYPVHHEMSNAAHLAEKNKKFLIKEINEKMGDSPEKEAKL